MLFFIKNRKRDLFLSRGIKKCYLIIFGSCSSLPSSSVHTHFCAGDPHRENKRRCGALDRCDPQLGTFWYGIKRDMWMLKLKNEKQKFEIGGRKREENHRRRTVGPGRQARREETAEIKNPRKKNDMKQNRTFESGESRGFSNTIMFLGSRVVREGAGLGFLNKKLLK